MSRVESSRLDSGVVMWAAVLVMSLLVVVVVVAAVFVFGINLVASSFSSLTCALVCTGNLLRPCATLAHPLLLDEPQDLSSCRASAHLRAHPTWRSWAHSVALWAHRPSSDSSERPLPLSIIARATPSTSLVSAEWRATRHRYRSSTCARHRPT